MLTENLVQKAHLGESLAEAFSVAVALHRQANVVMKYTAWTLAKIVASSFERLGGLWINAASQRFWT